MCQSLNYYAHVSAQFLRTNDPSSNFAAIAWLFVLARRNNNSVFRYILPFLMKHEHFFFRTLCTILKTENKHPSPNKRLPLCCNR